MHAFWQLKHEKKQVDLELINEYCFQSFYLVKLDSIVLICLKDSLSCS